MSETTGTTGTTGTAGSTGTTRTADVTGALVGLVERVTGLPGLSPASRFQQLENWTSLAALRLLTDVEDAFGVQLDLRTYFAVADVAGLGGLVTAALADR
ncbi:phosphopantetheine-binding protein [Kitasatospora sp. NPDC048538]|uniref:acyl carrier protein n=1 Tax=unclassified Kitasatospora TaxID=2633591 RepID=UPI0033EF01E0